MGEVALFGKLPARRDFVARGVPNTVLERLEPWLQECIAQSRETLGKLWLEAFLAAPLWRFWCAAPTFGGGIAGVLMPSVDKMGRYFPLTAFALAAHGEEVALPTSEDQSWYEAMEDALLSALTEDAQFDDLLSALAALPATPRSGVPCGRTGTLWWTIGGPGAPPRRTSFPDLPPPTAFADMLATIHEPEPAPEALPGAAS